MLLSAKLDHAAPIVLKLAWKRRDTSDPLLVTDGALILDLE
jgi:hypothetical protein